MRRPRLLAGAAVLATLLAALALAWYAASPPKPGHGRRAIAVVDAQSAYPRQLVRIRQGDGSTAAVVLRDGARRYEVTGPVSVVVVDGAPPAVYDANGRPNRGRGRFGFAGLALVSLALLSVAWRRSRRGTPA